jgi:enoyl-CoA hydratase/carnithine racemase
MDLQHVIIEKIGHIYHMRLNRPERLNAIGTQIRHDLGQAWYEFENDPEMRIAVVSGEGRIFSAGRDIREQAERGGNSTTGGIEVTNPDAPVSKTGFYGVPDTDKPIITAVQGGAWGAGFYIVCGSDICVAAEGARFAMSEIPTGIIGPALFPILQNLPWLPGSEICIRGHQFDAQRAYELGIINHVVPESELMSTAMDIAEEIAGLPPIHVQVTKQQLMMARPRPNTYQNDIAFPQALQSLMPLDDTKEAAMAFAEKRTPIFKGR